MNPLHKLFITFAIVSELTRLPTTDESHLPTPQDVIPVEGWLVTTSQFAKVGKRTREVAFGQPSKSVNFAAIHITPELCGAIHITPGVRSGDAGSTDILQPSASRELMTNDRWAVVL
jgi:L-2-hydroxyglutarate oxidase LhgO